MSIMNYTLSSKAFNYVEHKNNINEQTKQKQTHRYTEQIDGCQKGGALGAR